MRNILIGLCLCGSLVCAAGNKINLTGLYKIDSQLKECLSRGAESSPGVAEALVLMNADWTDEGFEKLGAKVVQEIDSDIIIISVPVDRMIEFSELPQVEYVEYGVDYHASLDFGRPASFVTDVQQGFDLDGKTVSFDGSGVVAGIMDQGIDPNHINFKDGSTCRVKEAYDYAGNRSATTPAQMKRFTTDMSDKTHGTHVAGIMAGSYSGEGTAMTTNTATGGGLKTLTTIPFYGVATGSDIVMAGGPLSNTNITKGVTAAIEYAEDNGMPVVVNLSLGSNDGPHDGSDLISKSLESLGERGIICIAAGNEGDSRMFVGKKFTASDNVLRTFIAGNESSGVDIWSNDSRALKVSVALYTVSSTKLDVLAELSQPGSASSPASFGTYFDGSFSLSAEVNRLNQRYHVQLAGTFAPKGTGRNVALIIEGADGQQVYVYGFGDFETSFASNSISGYTNGSTNGTISGLACAGNTVAIGSYTTRTSWGTFAGVYSYTAQANLKVDEVSSFSSYGTTFQGVSLPVVCAPGANIISSLNRYYTRNISNPSTSSALSAKVDASDLVNYWGAMQGTSMACPYAAGTVALWLQADPSLDCAEVIDIMKTTAIDPNPDDGGIIGGVKKNPQWGAGKIDALAGIREVLRRKGESGGINGVVTDAGGYVITPVGDRAWNIVVDGAASIEAVLYNLQGVAVATAQSQNGEVTLDAASATPGVYILAVTTPNTARIARRVALR